MQRMYVVRTPAQCNPVETSSTLSTVLIAEAWNSLARSNEVLKTKGIKGFYKGWGSYTLLACKPAIQCAYILFNNLSLFHANLDASCDY